MKLGSSSIGMVSLKRHLAGWVLTGVVLLLPIGCATTPESPMSEGLVGATIVERSKESPPNWTVSKPNVLTGGDQSEFYSLVYYKDRLLNLPLGIKQAQISALDVSQRALEDLLRGQVVGFVKAKQASVKTQTPEFDRQISATVKAFHSENARVQDMYFERLSHTPPLDDGNIRETYRVFVLVKIARKGVPELISQLGRRLASSEDTSLRSLGLLLRKEATQITSH